jgi:hypothetical protein
MIRYFLAEGDSGQRDDHRGAADRHLFESASARAYRHALHADLLHSLQAGRVYLAQRSSVARHRT